MVGRAVASLPSVTVSDAFGNVLGGVTLEQLATRPPSVLLRSAYRRSERSLGQVWLDHWLRSPIWRFWLGRRIAGRTVVGALMPSVDGVGRYFPLCLPFECDCPIMRRKRRRRS